MEILLKIKFSKLISRSLRTLSGLNLSLKFSSKVSSTKTLVKMKVIKSILITIISITIKGKKRLKKMSKKFHLKTSRKSNFTITPLKTSFLCQISSNLRQITTHSTKNTRNVTLNRKINKKLRAMVRLLTTRLFYTTTSQTWPTPKTSRWITLLRMVLCLGLIFLIRIKHPKR